MKWQGRESKQEECSPLNFKRKKTTCAQSIQICTVPLHVVPSSLPSFFWVVTGEGREGSGGRFLLKSQKMPPQSEQGWEAPQRKSPLPCKSSSSITDYPAAAPRFLWICPTKIGLVLGEVCKRAGYYRLQQRYSGLKNCYQQKKKANIPELLSTIETS